MEPGWVIPERAPGDGQGGIEVVEVVKDPVGQAVAPVPEDRLDVPKCLGASSAAYHRIRDLAQRHTDREIADRLNAAGPASMAGIGRTTPGLNPARQVRPSWGFVAISRSGKLGPDSGWADPGP